MLTALQIADIVLIDRIEIQPAGGLTVLTGETGSGKSIILDGLAFALGGKADRSLLRAGAPQGSVTAVFDLPQDHPALQAAAESGLCLAGEPLVLRRIIGSDGRSRAFVNDAPVSLGLLRRLGDCLVEIHGQHDDRGLLDPVAHRALLDAFGGLDALADDVSRHWQALQAADAALAAAQEEHRRAAADGDYLRHVAGELDALDPKPGEEADLAAARVRLGQSEKLVEAVAEAEAALVRDGGLAARLCQARRRLERAGEKAAGLFESAIAALDRAELELGEAEAALDGVRRALAHEPDRLEAIEARLFALRAAARKHGVTPDQLPDFRARIGTRVSELDLQEGAQARLEQARAKARTGYDTAAAALGERRRQAAQRLDAAVARELKPLKLDKAVFRTRIEALNPGQEGPGGTERVTFMVSTNPGAEPGPLNRIASGGELARFVLALKVVLARGTSATTLIFDEVDRGVGGAVAAAVGERLARLAQGGQVLVVTHSPQVAARADQHWRISKGPLRKGAPAVSTRIDVLAAAARREEIARMLAGATVTDEARAAAERLMADVAPAGARV